MTSAPTSVLVTFPTPPAAETPPTYAAAIALSGSGVKLFGGTAERLLIAGAS